MIIWQSYLSQAIYRSSEDRKLFKVAFLVISYSQKSKLGQGTLTPLTDILKVAYTHFESAASQGTRHHGTLEQLAPSPPLEQGCIAV